MTGKRLLYVGPLIEGSTTVQRLNAFRSAGCKVRTVSTAATRGKKPNRPSLLQRLRRRLFGPVDYADANGKILAAMRSEPFDVVWIDKGLTIRPETLRGIGAVQPACRIVGFSPDDMMNRANQSRNFLRGLSLYHCFVTTKSYNVTELRQLGCPRTLFMDNAYDPGTHRPVELTSGDRDRLGGPVGFIGQWEPERAESMRKLALAGIPVRVWGYTWERMKNAPALLRLENQPLWGDDYARGLCAFGINLCFLRKCNRDLQTTRTMEIPACRAFMLAERTEEHQRLFAEGKEAEYFASDHELLEKVRFYLAHEEKRLRIARGGYEKCLRGGYSYQERLTRVLDELLKS